MSDLSDAEREALQQIIERHPYGTPMADVVWPAVRDYYAKEYDEATQELARELADARREANEAKERERILRGSLVEIAGAADGAPLPPEYGWMRDCAQAVLTAVPRESYELSETDAAALLGWVGGDSLDWEALGRDQEDAPAGPSHTRGTTDV